MKKTLVKKQIKDELVTKTYLDEKLEVNKQYLDEKLEVNKQYLDEKLEVNKQYFDNKIDKVVNELVNYISNRFQPIEEKVQKIDSIDKRLESIMKTLAWLAGEYKRFDEEYAVASEQTHRVNGKLDNHEERISSLEQRVASP